MALSKSGRFLGYALLAFATVASALVVSASAGPSKGKAAAGKVVFVQKACATCHKANGAGGVKLTGNPSPSWIDKKRMATITDDYLRDCITNGKIKSGMVAWGKTGQIKPAQIEDLIAYIRTFAK